MNMLTDSHDAVTADWAAALLDFWFNEVGEKGWWSHDPQLDHVCAQKFAHLWREKKSQAAADFQDRADDALAAVILFDQLPRNMFRGTADAFATDALARDIARGAIAHGYDVQIGGAGRCFFYMPFMHSEDRADQDLSLTLFEGAGDAKWLEFARKHHEMIQQFGRFPHRNAVLGRMTRSEEEDVIADGADW
ncbi:MULTISPECIES: DUF924 family protein [Sphingobium]|jgi:uncharacterized protein (DUF924 family)|uniref:DUF924 family protein n=1 Tax=Sphingobium TaxID=165695 RepID=UPI000C672738|nr:MULTISPECIES: DUF924 family protein [Sphingobium]MAP45708.1 hypothetical protein [Sphingobium sp.]MEC9017373.1 DUF924 family protein [Pseudomonadota bacterium]MBA38895.1 hypothetical protein [Sphingobium sp.]MBS47659.1 hypothetical protein [Sphingobium sp.]MCC4255922.1 DUF924 domain-containing protein [Sphingobium lactosutens]|tara:strand:- start:7 stop:582 length:576 start_codon:yes stop_codon:yes gene_type:complete